MPPRTVAIIGVVALLAGLAGGYVLFSGGSSGQSTSSGSSKASVVDSSINGLKSAPRSNDGAARAVTSFATALGSLALETPEIQTSALDSSLAKTADPSLRQKLQTDLQYSRQQLIGSDDQPHQLTAKVAQAPVTYRVDPVDTTHVRVRAWMVTTAIDTSTQKANANWTTIDAQLVWTDHWRIASYTNSDGPTPTTVNATGQFSTFNDVVGVFSGFTAYRYAVGG